MFCCMKKHRFYILGVLFVFVSIAFSTRWVVHRHFQREQSYQYSAKVKLNHTGKKEENPTFEFYRYMIAFQDPTIVQKTIQLAEKKGYSLTREEILQNFSLKDVKNKLEFKLYYTDKNAAKASFVVNTLAEQLMTKSSYLHLVYSSTSKKNVAKIQQNPKKFKGVANFMALFTALGVTSLMTASYQWMRRKKQ